MRKIAVVEDEDSAADLLSGYIAKFCAETNQELEIVRFRDAVWFLENYKSEYVVIFMDIQMPNCDGMKATAELRKKDATVSVIFITNLVQYAQKGYEVNALAYLLKPVKYQDLCLKLRKAIDLYTFNRKKDIFINTQDGGCFISTDSLIYVETVRHRLYYHTVDGIFEITGVLSKVEEQLKKYGFLRCNQCYLVNPVFITRVKGYFVELGAETLAISRPRKKAFLQDLANRYAGLEGKK